MILAGCKTSSSTSLPSVVTKTRAAYYPDVPSDIRGCFGMLVRLDPKLTTMTSADVVRLIGDLRKSEVSKSRCGQRLLGWYDRLRKG